MSPARLETLKASGVNLVIGSYQNDKLTAAWVRTVERIHLHILLEPDLNWIKRGQLSRLEAFARRYRSSTALYGWYLYDEPDFNNLPPDRLVAAYQTIKRLSTRPVAVVFTQGQCLFKRHAIDPRYLPGFDLLMFDRYPFYTNLPGVRPLADQRTIGTNCRRSALAHHKQGPFLVLQAFGKGWRDGPFRWRDPSNRESVCSFRIATQSGATGILFYSASYADARVLHNTDSIIRRWTSGSERPPGTAQSPAC